MRTQVLGYPTSWLFSIFPSPQGERGFLVAQAFQPVLAQAKRAWPVKLATPKRLKHCRGGFKTRPYGGTVTVKPAATFLIFHLHRHRKNLTRHLCPFPGFGKKNRGPRDFNYFPWPQFFLPTANSCQPTAINSATARSLRCWHRGW